MRTIKPTYVVALVLVIGLVVVLKLINPHKKYSTQSYWQSATISDVVDVPDAALKPGNKNGSVLMWAAMEVDDPSILRALVARGADVNEHDPIFSGTPLTGAAGYTAHPQVIRELVSLGADVHDRVNNRDTALMVAAMYNINAGIIDELISQGANINDTNSHGDTALDLAKQYKNRRAIDALTALTDADG